MLLPLLLSLSLPPKIDFYIGTYTSPEGSQGIYVSQLDTESGELSPPELAAVAESPSFLAQHPKGHFLYAVHEAGKGEVSAYRIEKDRKLTLLSTQESSGNGPCHLSVDPKGKNVLVASYGSGAAACLPIGRDGALMARSGVIQNAGSGPNKERQDGPHMHSIFADRKSRFAYACDLGTDEVLVFDYDAKAGTIVPREPRSVKSPAGAGPRHFTFGKGGRFAYVNNELIPCVSVYAVDGKNGGLTELQTISTLPEGEAIGRKSTAEIELHPNGKWLYVSNRNHDSIAIFDVLKDGTLRLVDIEPSGVREPRSFAIDPSGKWLVAAGQNSNDLTTLAIDPASGKLQPTGFRVKLDKPVCVLFTR